MIRRIHIPLLHTGEMELGAAQAHHARDVLRLRKGDALELFDDEGAIGQCTIVLCSPRSVRVRVVEVSAAGSDAAVELAVAAAVPKGARADWMIEKLSELGTARFIPLRTERSVVLPEGKNKVERWSRLAREAARQSRRRGVMEIGPLVRLEEAIQGARSEGSAVWHLSTFDGAEPMAARTVPSRLLVLIGPEGGWSDEETLLFGKEDIPGVALTPTILRVETAAVAAATIALCVR
jgi:16S rRNA (uracil1498-N3)-methyltransferase